MLYQLLRLSLRLTIGTRNLGLYKTRVAHVSKLSMCTLERRVHLPEAVDRGLESASNPRVKRRVKSVDALLNIN